MRPRSRAALCSDDTRPRAARAARHRQGRASQRCGSGSGHRHVRAAARPLCRRHGAIVQGDGRGLCRRRRGGGYSASGSMRIFFDARSKRIRPTHICSKKSRRLSSPRMKWVCSAAPPMPPCWRAGKTNDRHSGMRHLAQARNPYSGGGYGFRARSRRTRARNDKVDGIKVWSKIIRSARARRRRRDAGPRNRRKSSRR